MASNVLFRKVGFQLFVYFLINGYLGRATEELVPVKSVICLWNFLVDEEKCWFLLVLLLTVLCIAL